MSHAVVGASLYKKSTCLSEIQTLLGIWCLTWRVQLWQMLLDCPLHLPSSPLLEGLLLLRRLESEALILHTALCPGSTWLPSFRFAHEEREAFSFGVGSPTSGATEPRGFATAPWTFVPGIPGTESGEAARQTGPGSPSWCPAASPWILTPGLCPWRHLRTQSLGG